MSLMVFRIFKEMVAAVKKGVAEAKAELAEEKAENDVLEQQKLHAIRNQPQAKTCHCTTDAAIYRRKNAYQQLG
jgi:Sec-independent protein translocase protein TatA